VLSALERLRLAAPGLNMLQAVALLYIAENPGISFSDLAAASGAPLSTISRAARALLSAQHQDAVEPGYGLVDMSSHPRSSRLKQLRLSDLGLELISRLNDDIAAARQIRPQPAVFSAD
jgi:DNA-binding MarR family transcriptional regulator